MNQNISSKKAKNIVLSIIVGSFFFFIGNRFVYLFPQIMKQTSSYIAYPALLTHYYVVDPIKVWFFQRKTMQQLMNVCKELTQERDMLLAENIKLRASSDYKQDVAELIDFKKKYDPACSRLVQILVRCLSDRAHFFLIDAGVKHGIHIDMVVVYKNCLVGKVIEVYPWYSKVQLITDVQSKIAGYCAQTNAQGIYEGTNNENQGTLQYVSHLKQVKQGDMVMSSGEGLIFPRGFALGKIIDISPMGLYHLIKVKPVINLRSIQYCLVIMNDLR